LSSKLNFFTYSLVIGESQLSCPGFSSQKSGHPSAIESYLHLGSVQPGALGSVLQGSTIGQLSSLGFYLQNKGHPGFIGLSLQSS
jgi:hypothetical protein